MTAAEDAARVAGAAQLTVRASTGAEPFYRSLGFTKTARTDFNFPDGTTMPVVLMEKGLR